MPKISTSTKSFIILFCIAVFGVFLSVSLWSDLNSSPYYDLTQQYYQETIPSPQAMQQQEAQAQIDTSSWKTYTDKQFNFSFKYKPDWKVLAAKTTKGFTILQVDPGIKYYNIRIYISPKGYYVLDGLPTTHDTIGGMPALNVNNMLYGVKDGANYFTFDIGLSVSLKPNFDALVHSVTFGN